MRNVLGIFLFQFCLFSCQNKDTHTVLPIKATQVIPEEKAVKMMDSVVESILRQRKISTRIMDYSFHTDNDTASKTPYKFLYGVSKDKKVQAAVLVDSKNEFFTLSNSPEKSIVAVCIDCADMPQFDFKEMGWNCSTSPICSECLKVEVIKN